MHDKSVRKQQKGNAILRRSDGTKYLGTVIYDKLPFKYHCDYMLKEIAEKTSFLNRIVVAWQQIAIVDQK